MSEYNTIEGLDRARYEALLNAPLPDPLPANAVLVIGADWCPDTQRSIMGSNYPTKAANGAPIFYLNDANPAAHNVLRTLPGREILGGGVESETPPVHPVRQYNYPTVVSIENGALNQVLYADTVPPSGLLLPVELGEMWQRGEAERARRANFPQYDGERAAPLFNMASPTALEPNHVYAVVSRNCGHCHELLARTGYPTHTEDGRAITYVELSGGTTPFFDQHLRPLGVQGFPTFISTDAQGVASIRGVGTDPIIEQFFPNALTREAARGATQGVNLQGITETPVNVPAGPANTPDQTRDANIGRGN